MARNRSNAARRIIRARRIGTEALSHIEVARVEVPTALQELLHRLTRLRALLRPHLPVIRALFERVEPDEGTNDDDANCIADEEPVEHHERFRDVVGLDDRRDGGGPCYE